MDSDKLDKYLQDRLEDYHEVIDKEALWNDLDLKPHKRKKRILFFWFAGLLGLFMISYLTYQSNASIDFIDESIVSSPPSSPSTPVLANKIRTESFDPISGDRNTSITKQSNSFTNQPSVEIKESVVAAGSNLRHKLISTNLSKRISEKHLTTSIIKKSQLLSKQTHLVDESPKARKDRPAIRVTEPVSESIQNVKLVQLGTLTQFANASNRALVEIKSPFSEVELVENIANVKPWTINFNNSVFMLDRQLTALGSNSEPLDQYVANRNRTESMNEALAVGLGVGFQFNNGVYLKVGLEGLTINEQFNVTYSNDSLVAASGLVLQYPSDSITTFLGQNYTNKLVTERWNNSNNHLILSLPLSLGFRMAFNRWGLKAEVTGILSRHMKFSGVMLSQENNVISSTNVFNKFGWGLRGGLGVDYLISDKFTFSLMSQVQHDGSSLLKKETNIKQQYFMLGFQLGVSYRL